MFFFQVKVALHALLGKIIAAVWNFHTSKGKKKINAAIASRRRNQTCSQGGYCFKTCCKSLHMNGFSTENKLFLEIH